MNADPNGGFAFIFVHAQPVCLLAVKSSLQVKPTREGDFNAGTRRSLIVAEWENRQVKKTLQAVLTRAWVTMDERMLLPRM